MCELTVVLEVLSRLMSTHYCSREITFNIIKNHWLACRCFVFVSVCITYGPPWSYTGSRIIMLHCMIMHLWPFIWWHCVWCNTCSMRSISTEPQPAHIAFHCTAVHACVACTVCALSSLHACFATGPRTVHASAYTIYRDRLIHRLWSIDWPLPPRRR